jgi:hypothetical protein
MKRNAAHEKQLTEQAMRLVAHMQTLDLVKTPETATSLKHTAAEIIGCPVNAIPGVVQHALRKGLLEERELPQGQRRGQRTHSLHVAPRKF